MGLSFCFFLLLLLMQIEINWLLWALTLKDFEKEEISRYSWDHFIFLFAEITPTTVTACTTAWCELAGTLCTPPSSAVELSHLTTGPTWTRPFRAPVPLKLTAKAASSSFPPGWLPTQCWCPCSVLVWWLSRSWECVWPAVWPGQCRSTTSQYNSKCLSLEQLPHRNIFYIEISFIWPHTPHYWK